MKNIVHLKNMCDRTIEASIVKGMYFLKLTFYTVRVAGEVIQFIQYKLKTIF